MELGYAPLAYGPEELPRAFEDLRACRYSGVDIVLAKIREVGFKTVRESLRSAQLTPFCVVAGWLDTPETVEMILDKLPSVSELGASTLGFIPPQRHTVETGVFEGWVDRLSSECVDYDIIPLVHHHAGSLIERPAEIGTFLDRKDIDLLFDTGHYQLFEDPVTGLQKFGDRVAHVHLRDVDPAAPREYFETCIKELSSPHPNFDCVTTVYRSFSDLGEGNVPIAGVCEILSDRQYQGTLTIETDNRCQEPLIHAKRNADTVRRYI